MYEDSGFHHQDLSANALAGMAEACDVVGMNEDEFIRHLDVPVDLGDPLSVGAGLDRLRGRWGITNLVVHTARWAAVSGPQAEQLRPALAEGILAGAARFSYGDAMTQQDLDDLRAATRNSTGALVAAGLERAGFTAVPALDLYPDEPVTVGLGDSFVGGFLAGLHRSGIPADLGRRGDNARRAVSFR